LKAKGIKDYYSDGSLAGVYTPEAAAIFKVCDLGETCEVEALVKVSIPIRAPKKMLKKPRSARIWRRNKPVHPAAQQAPILILHWK
jgi:hypothetical protein